MADDDYSSLATPGPSGLSSFQPPGESDTEKQAFSKLADYGSRLSVKAKMDEDPPAGVESIKIDKDGMMQAKFHRDVFEGLMRDRQELNTIRGSFHQESERLKAQEERLRTPGGAILQGLSSLAGNIASTPNMPGWTRAIAASTELLLLGPNCNGTHRASVPIPSPGSLKHPVSTRPG